MSTALFRILGVPLAVLALGLMLALSASPARAAGEGGGEPGPSPVNLALDAFTLDRAAGSVAFAGTTTCAEGAEVLVSMAVQQGPVQRFVEVRQVAKFRCEAGTATPVELLFAPEPGRFHPGAIVVGIELEAWTDGGTYLTQFGIVDRRV